MHAQGMQEISFATTTKIPRCEASNTFKTRHRLTVASLFHGEISDSQCAMKVHPLSRSHQEMSTNEDDGPGSHVMRPCVRRSWRGYALSSGDVVYRLKSQNGIQEFAGQRVKVIGILDAKTNTIDNASIEIAPMATRPAPSR
jgi:hypothetical protein